MYTLNYFSELKYLLQEIDYLKASERNITLVLCHGSDDGEERVPSYPSLNLHGNVQQIVSGVDTLVPLTELYQFAQVASSVVKALMRQRSCLFGARTKVDAWAHLTVGRHLWSMVEG